MLEKSCRWWLIWCLLFFCRGGAEGQLQWVVKVKVTAYGHNLTLFCPVENCCSRPAGWSVGDKTIIIDVKTFSNDPKVKYHGIYNKDGFGVVIRNLSEADLNVTYRCVYGFDQSTPKYLLHGDVFRENVPDKEKENDTTATIMYIVVPIVVIMVAIGFIIGMAYCVKSRIKKKIQGETGTDEEMEVFCRPDIQMENQQEGHNKLVEEWRIEDELYYETGGFKAVLDMVKSKNYITIIGGPGSGKTATARHIALQLEMKGWKVVPVCKLKDIIEYGDRDHKQVFVLDDVLGIFAVDMNFDNYIFNHKEQIFTTIGKTSKLLFTCRKSVYKEAFKLGLFVTENVIDLQSKDNQLTETEKMDICQYHCEAKGVSSDLYAFLSFNKANHMFPFLCKIFSREKNYQQLGERFFNTPFRYYIGELDKLQHTNRIQYAVLVLCLINDSKLSIECLPLARMKEVFNNCRVNQDTSDEQIRDAIYRVSGTYFIKLDTEYIFINDFIFEAIAYHYGRENQQHILKYLSSSYIANKVTVYKQASKHDLCIQISEDMYSPLANRLYRDIQSKNLFDVFMNQSLKHDNFRDVFERMLKSKPFHNFESLILRKCEIIQHFVNTTFSVKEPIQKNIDIIENDRLHVLFDTIHQTVVGSRHTYYVRVISWIINYGHTHLLKEIVNHVKRNNHSINLIFSSDVMENTRLLLLGCYSNTLDMVELILKYVDPKCIDTKFKFVSRITRKVTPLIAGCMLGNLCIVEALLRNHAAINKCTYWNGSPLITASSHGHIDVVKCLLRSKADIHLRDRIGQSPLFAASMEGHCDVIKYLLRSGANINMCDVRRQSPLFATSKSGKCDAVKFLLSSGADINMCDIMGQSPLLAASMSGQCDVVKCLLSSGADINICDVMGQSPLLAASMSGQCDVVKCLLSSGADINMCDVKGQSPLLAASMSGQCDVVKCLLKSGADINMCDVRRQSPLFIASESGHCNVVECLKSLTADINLCNEDGQSPLFVASKYGHCDVVKCLLSSGAGVNVCDVRIQSPLFVASSYGKCDVVKCLRSFNADINSSDEEGYSPLLIALEYAHCDVAKYLLSSGADIRLCNKRGQSPLFVASSSGHCDVVKCLLRSGADINMCDVRGQSPLFIASMFGKCDVVEYLLSSSAEIMLCNELGQSPLFVASSSGHCDVVKCLLRSGADINMCNARRQSPLFVASQFGKCDVVKCLLSSGADNNLCDENGRSPLCVATSNDIVICFTGHEALREENVKA